MHNTIACHPPTDLQPLPKQWLPPPPLSSASLSFHMMSCGTEYLFGQFGPAVLFCLPPAPCAPPAPHWQDSMRS